MQVEACWFLIHSFQHDFTPNQILPSWLRTCSSLSVETLNLLLIILCFCSRRACHERSISLLFFFKWCFRLFSCLNILCVLCVSLPFLWNSYWYFQLFSCFAIQYFVCITQFLIMRFKCTSVIATVFMIEFWYALCNLTGITFDTNQTPLNSLPLW